MSGVGKPGYKETAVGWIPVEWDVIKLGSLCSVITKGTTPTTVGFQYQPAGVNFVKVECIDGYGNLDLNKVAFITSDAHEALGRSKLQAGDILYSIAGAIGRSAIVQESHLPANINQALAIVRLSAQSLDTEFVRLCLSSEWQLSHIAQISVSSAQANISLKDVSEFDVLLPPLPEQQKIAAILTAVDDKLDLIARQISATQTLKQGLMQNLFTRGTGTPDAQGRWHPHTEFQDSPIGLIPRSWDARKLEELATENITYGVVQPGEANTGGVPLVRGGDIKNGKIASNLRTVSQEISLQFKRTVLQGGELLVSLVGYPGETAVVPEALAGANIARQAGMIRTSSLAMSKFIHCYLASPTGKACLLGGMIGSAQQVINLKSLREVYVPMPAEAEREQISAICEEVFNKLDALTTQQTHYQSLKRGLMQKLLTGQWRVRVDAAALAPVHEEAPA